MDCGLQISPPPHQLSPDHGSSVLFSGATKALRQTEMVAWNREHLKKRIIPLWKFRDIAILLRFTLYGTTVTSVLTLIGLLD